MVVHGLQTWGFKVILLCFLLATNCIIVLAQEDANEGLCSASYDEYIDALGKSILFFEGQRSGKLPSEGQRVKWRGDSALSDGNLENVNLVGGYYDAGDNVKFVWPMSFSITLLSWSAIEYKNELSSFNQLGYLREAIKWGTDFILQAHPSSTTFYTQVGDASADHQCWERPEDMDTPRTLYKITSSSPGSEAAAEAAASLSAASIGFQRRRLQLFYYTIKPLQICNDYTILNKFTDQLFEFADKYRGSYSSSCPFYCSYSGYQDELLWAAAWLYKATGDAQYLDYATSNQGWSQAVSEFSWDNKFAGAQILLAKEFLGGNENLIKFKSDVDSFICSLMPGSSSQQIKTTPGGLMFTRDGSNLQYVTSSTMLLYMYSTTLDVANVDGVHCGSTKFSTSQIKAFAKSQVDYILGSNPKNMSYMLGHGTKYPTQLHHRGSSIPTIHTHEARIGCNDGLSNYYYSTGPNPNTHQGIVGGPNEHDEYNDARSEYAHAEPTTYMNAAFVGSVAALLRESKDECMYASVID